MPHFHQHVVLTCSGDSVWFLVDMVLSVTKSDRKGDTYGKWYSVTFVLSIISDYLIYETGWRYSDWFSIP